MKTILERSTEDTEPAKITVIVPVRNEAMKIGRCLEALLAQSLPPREIIVVDGHSTDKTVEVAGRYPVRVLYEDIGTRAGANKIGIMNAQGDYIAFTDADCIPDRNWLRNLMKEFEGDVVGVGGAIHNVANSAWEESINLAMESFLGSAQSVQGRVFKTKRTVSSISGCNSVYKKEALMRVGGFDEGLPTAEDTELNRRLREIGPLIYTPDAIISHNHTRGLREFTKRTYQYGYGKGKCLIRDLQLIPPIALVAILFLPLISVWAFLFMMVLYFSVLIGYTSIICWRARNHKHFGRILVTFVAEHVAYTLGIWKGLFSWALNSVRSSKRSARPT